LMKPAMLCSGFTIIFAALKRVDVRRYDAAVRYDGAEPTTHDRRLSDALDRNGGGAGVYTFGVLSHLLAWHRQYPVQAWERARNDAVCAAQGGAVVQVGSS
jgi:uncharacterized protein YbjT (DUF2867 family)